MGWDSTELTVLNLVLSFFTSLVTGPQIFVSLKPLGSEKKGSGADEHPSAKAWN